MHSTRMKQFFIFMFFVILLTYILFLNFLTPKMVEEFPRTLNFNGFFDAISKVSFATLSSYMNIGGRVFSWITQFSLLPVVSLFNVLNSIIFCLFVYGIFLTTHLRRPSKYQDLFTLIIIFSIQWFFVRELAEAIFWKVAATTYIWPLTGTLFFIYPFLHLLINNKDLIQQSRVKLTLMAIAGIFLGTGHELLSVAICPLLIFTNLIYFIREKKIIFWSILSTLTYLLGTFILIIAPGNYRRAASNPELPYTVMEKGVKLSEQIYVHLGRISESLPLFSLLMVALIILLLEKAVKNVVLRSLFTLLAVICTVLMLIPQSTITRIINPGLFSFLTLIFLWLLIKKSARDFKLPCIFLILSLVSSFACIGVPNALSYGAREAFFSDTFFIIAIVALLSQKSSLKYWNIGYGLVSLIALFLLVPSMASNYKDTKHIHEAMEKRIALFSFYKDNNNTNVVLPSLFDIYDPKYIRDDYKATVDLYTPHLVYKDLSDSDPLHWTNKGFASYYGFPQAIITIRPQVELWNTLRQKMPSNPSDINFNIFKMDQKLFFVNMLGSCDSLINKAPLFLYVYPKNIHDLPKSQRKSGYERWDIGVTPEHMVTVISATGQIKHDVCVLATPLPNYSINKVEAGQK